MKSILCLLACILVITTAVADDPASYQSYAKPVSRVPPKYPISELNRGRQGWVELNYVVTEEGQVVEPVVEASSGSGAFERAAIATVKQWRYEPARVDGEPIQQCKTAVRISFALEGAETGVTRKFRSRYMKIDKALKKQDLDFASAELEKAFESEGLTLGELSWLWALEARIAAMRGDKDQQLTAVRRALAVSDSWIPEELREWLLTNRVILEIEQRNFAAAMKAYGELIAIDGADTAKLDPVAERIQAVVESDQPFFRPARIGGSETCETCTERWRYTPLRRALEITDIEGELENLELRCEWQRYVDEAREGVAWIIPDSWGECSVIVFGKTGSTFNLVELPET